MSDALAFYRWSELDRTTFPELRDRILTYEEAGLPPRSYAGYPKIALDRVRPRALGSLDRALVGRRCARGMSGALPPRRVLSRLLSMSHGAWASGNRGPVPSAGGLQALELYVVSRADGWLPPGAYHYDRAGHHLSRVAEPADWATMIPSLVPGPLLWVIVGDAARGEAKYAERAYRFLLLEAGHLMQNLALVSSSLKLSTVPLGGFFEREVARALGLPATDVVAYVGVCGSGRNR